jgi:hypothetical protein
VVAAVVVAAVVVGIAVDNFDDEHTSASEKSQALRSVEKEPGIDSPVNVDGREPPGVDIVGGIGIGIGHASCLGVVAVVVVAVVVVGKSCLGLGLGLGLHKEQNATTEVMQTVVPRVGKTL